MPQPIDMQTEITRISMAERMQDASTRASLAAQQRAAQDSEENDQLREVQVNETEESENPDVDADGKRKNPFGGRRKKRQAPLGDEGSHTVYTADETKEVLEDPDDHRLDVTI